MSEKLKIFVINNKFDEILLEFRMTKPETYEKFIRKLSKKVKDIENYTIIMKSSNNEEIVVNNDKSYKLSKDILYMKKFDKFEEQQSMYEINYE